ncbi:MAG TPA: adenylosuccinate lyase [Cytophagales bacterium]|nr:adenylosuccinate lyase [Cytophagales bacterium]
MNLNKLTAISPIDGRYRDQVTGLVSYFSEFGLIKYRLLVEVEYFIALCQLPLPQLKHIDHNVFDKLRSIYLNFNEQDANAIKEIEKVTNHDVKAVEYFIKNQFQALNLNEYLEFIHFGLTSQDINNTAIPLLLKDATEKELIPKINEIKQELKKLALKWKDIPMLARTHGQPASPTRLGKELAVFYERLEGQLNMLEQIPFSAKFGGATGNFNAHHLAFPKIDWVQFSNNFVNQTLGLSRRQLTTQIEHYDYLGAFFDGIKRINTILIDLNRDVWQYISIGYFTQKIKEGEIGSSAMPHKVNPIDFENSEGNLGIANALLEHFSAKLPISRLQRDLTDSTVLRNIGIPLSHAFIALKSLSKGLGKIEVNIPQIENDLEENWAVVAEGIQTILRREGYPNPYEALKTLTRKNEAITKNTIQAFIETLLVSEDVKGELRKLSPSNYTGIDFSL